MQDFTRQFLCNWFPFIVKHSATLTGKRQRNNHGTSHKHLDIHHNLPFSICRSTDIHAKLLINPYLATHSITPDTLSPDNKASTFSSKKSSYDNTDAAITDTAAKATITPIIIKNLFFIAFIQNLKEQKIFSELESIATILDNGESTQMLHTCRSRWYSSSKVPPKS